MHAKYYQILCNKIVTLPDVQPANNFMLQMVSSCNETSSLEVGNTANFWVAISFQASRTIICRDLQYSEYARNLKYRERVLKQLQNENYCHWGWPRRASGIRGKLHICPPLKIVGEDRWIISFQSCKAIGTGFDWCRSLFTRDGNHMADQLSTQEVRRHRLRTLVLISMLSSIDAPVWMCSTI
ncbi:hypothetical protein Peur_032076 [Populus x canadensis]